MFGDSCFRCDWNRSHSSIFGLSAVFIIETTCCFQKYAWAVAIRVILIFAHFYYSVSILEVKWCHSSKVLKGSNQMKCIVQIESKKKLQKSANLYIDTNSAHFSVSIFGKHCFLHFKQSLYTLPYIQSPNKNRRNS